VDAAHQDFVRQSLGGHGGEQTNRRDAPKAEFSGRRESFSGRWTAVVRIWIKMIDFWIAIRRKNQKLRQICQFLIALRSQKMQFGSATGNFYEQRPNGRRAGTHQNTR
jgi:hypothetical protein